MGASNVLDDEKAQQVVRISKSAAWLSENFHKVPAMFVVLSRNDPTGSSIYPAIWSIMLAGRAHGVGTCLTTASESIHKTGCLCLCNILRMKVGL